MRTGQRNAWIGIYASTEAAGTSGDPKPSWSATPQVEVWARKRDLSQREAVVGAAVQPENSCVFEILFRDDITTSHRIKYGSIYYDVTAVKDPGENHAELHLHAIEGVRYGS